MVRALLTIICVLIGGVMSIALLSDVNPAVIGLIWLVGSLVIGFAISRT